MADLKFNVQEIKNMKDLCESSCTDLDNLNTTLAEGLQTLKNDWNTPAGDKFFSDLELDWTTQVTQYKKAATAMAALLEEAITQYSTIEEEANGLKF